MTWASFVTAVKSLLPLLIPTLIVASLLAIFGHYQDFGARTDLAALSLALALDGILFLNQPAPNAAPAAPGNQVTAAPANAAAKRWLCIVALGVAFFVLAFQLCIEFGLDPSAISPGLLPRIALLNLAGLALSVVSAVAARA